MFCLGWPYREALYQTDCLMIKWAMLMQQVIQEAGKDDFKSPIFLNLDLQLFYIVKIKSTVYSHHLERNSGRLYSVITPRLYSWNNAMSCLDKKTEDHHSLAKCLNFYNYFVSHIWDVLLAIKGTFNKTLTIYQLVP